MLELLFVDKVLGKNIGCHTTCVAVRDVESEFVHGLLQPGDRHLVNLVDVAQRRCFACPQDLGRRLIVLVQRNLNRPTKNFGPNFLRWHANGTHTDIAGHEF